MLLYANQDEKFELLKTMFSAFSSSYDPLNYHMIWHQRSILEAIDAFSSSDLHLLDMSFVHQLLCLGKCHWAIYVILHMPHLNDAPYIHEKLIREILSQYCELWSKDDAQRQYIVELGIPEEWMHESLVRIDFFAF
jgi:nuclear pore complex protein Nup98-Nup96